MHGRYLYRFYAPVDALEKLDWFKQSNLYVDIREDGFYTPSKTDDTVRAMDYFLSFAQERADSYSSFHVSEKRSVDFIQTALGDTGGGKWTRSFKENEVVADFLYQSSALSASRVPDYARFKDFLKSYSAKPVAEQRIRDALLTVASELRCRLVETGKLPIYQARFWGAYKLIFSVSDSSSAFPRKFRTQLRETLKLAK